MSNAYIVMTGDPTVVIGLRGKHNCIASAYSANNDPSYGEVIEMSAKRAKMFAASVTQDYMVNATVEEDPQEAEVALMAAVIS